MDQGFYLTIIGAIIGSVLGGLISFIIGYYFFKKSAFTNKLLQFVSHNAEQQYINEQINPIANHPRSKTIHNPRPENQNDDIPHLHKVIIHPFQISKSEIAKGKKVSVIFQITDNGMNFDCAQATRATHQYGKYEPLEIYNLDYGWMKMEVPTSKVQSEREYGIKLEFTDGKYENKAEIAYCVV